MKRSLDLTIDKATAAEAQKQLLDLTFAWTVNLTNYPGYADWKNRQIVHTLVAGHVPYDEPEPFEDFDFPKQLLDQIEIIQGYYALLSCVSRVRECRYYFMRYPFGGKNVSREAHLRTCCELFFSRVFQFRERFDKQIKWLDRRTKPKGLPILDLQKQFHARFGNLIDQRNDLHHKEDYSDIQTHAIGLSDLLAIGGGMPEWIAVSRANYLKIRKVWAAKVQTTADGLDIFVGAIAAIMLNRCDFLGSAATLSGGEG